MLEVALYIFVCVYLAYKSPRLRPTAKKLVPALVLGGVMSAVIGLTFGVFILGVVPMPNRVGEYLPCIIVLIPCTMLVTEILCRHHATKREKRERATLDS